jgi:hypothetical protein
MHASAPQISSHHTAPSFLGFNRERFISDETADRVAKIASVAFRYTTLAAIIAGSTYMSMGSFFVRSLIILSPVLAIPFVGGVIFQSGRDILNNSLVSIGPINRQPMSLETLSNKVDQTARVVLWTFMIVAAVSTGLAGGYCITGASFLYTAAQTGSTLALVKGLLDCTFALGFAIPFARRALPNTNLLYEGYDSVADELRNIIISLQNPSEEGRQNAVSFMQRIGQRLASFFMARLDFDTLMNAADIVPEALFQSQFIAQLPSFSDEKIAAIIDRFPIILTIDFLAKNMPQEKFNAIVAPKLVSPITSDQLAKMKTDIDAKEARLIELENAPNSPELSEETNQIASTINLYTRQVLQLRQFIQRLPAQGLPPQYRDLQERVNAARDLDRLAEETFNKLTGLEANSLKERLQRIQSRHIVQEAAEDLEDPNYEVLGAYGFTLSDFKTLGGRLGVNLGNQEIQRTCEYLDQYGLQDRRGLIEHHILDAPDEGERLNTEIIIERIVNFCQTRNNDEKIAPSPKEVEEASSAPEPAPLSAPMPPQVVPQPRWTRVSRVVNRIFHVTLTTSLMALQLYHLPISTSLGFVFRLTQNISNNRAFSTISRFSRPAPDYISQGFSERMRNLWVQIFINTWSLQIGPIGGFITGTIHADNTLSYLQQWRGRIRRQPSAA